MIITTTESPRLVPFVIKKSPLLVILLFSENISISNCFTNPSVSYWLKDITITVFSTDFKGK